MIAVKFEGRLGNQLFQYAFIYASSKKIKTGFYIDYSIQGNDLNKYFQLQFNRQQILDRYLLHTNRFNNITFYLKKKFYNYLNNFQQIYLSNDLDPDEELTKLKNNRLYKGYFQSEMYFSGYQTQVRNLFKIKKQYTSSFTDILESLPSYKKLVTIHVRRGDYLKLGWNISVEYYHQAINSIDEPGNLYVIISDDAEFAANEFSYLENLHISRNDEIIDFQFLIHADCCVISNSSFSWWGAYLNNKKAKVIAPKFWLSAQNEEWPNSIILKEWIKL